MKRFFGIIFIFALASSCASVALKAQSGRRGSARRAEPPKEERAEKSEEKDASKESARADEGKQVFTGKEVTVRAVVRARPEPGMPVEARRAVVEGTVKLRIILGADGKVRDEMDVLESLPFGVTEEAIKAARRIEFEPARKDGRPVSQYVTVMYHFNLY